ncbi:MAG: hypothetical protein KGH65_02615 [Candidatus Micrarchaeota archaeon]|nr:hypothetical protein [Candidatus Micrarchaeota archaeon]
MFENLTTGWRIGKAIRKLVFGDKGLLVYPLATAIAAIIEMVAIFGTFLLASGFSSAGYIAALIAFYVITTFTSTYLLVAMLLGFRGYTSGKRISFSQALAAAAPYSRLILEWALFYSVVLLIIRLIESRMRGIGGLILGSAVSIGLAVATVFVIPVIIDEKAGPIDAMKRSTDFFVKNFGKSAGGLIYSDLYNLMFIIGGILIGLLGAVIAISSTPLLGVPVFMVGFLVLIFGILMTTVMSNVFRFVLYEYMNGKKLPEGLSEELIRSSVKKKPV